MPTLSTTVSGFVAAREYDSATLHRLAFWTERFGDLELTEITPEMVDAALVELAERGRLQPRRGKATEAARKPLAPATLDRYTAQLASVYRYARRVRVLPRTHTPPTKGIEVHGSPVDHEGYFRPEEVERLLAVARLIDTKWRRMPALILLAFSSGLRKSNLLHLKWQDLDLVSRTAAVPRTKAGRPFVATFSAAAAAELQRLGPKHPENFVFENPRTGRPFHIRRLWLRVCQEAGFGSRRFHELRHGCGSALAAAGVSLPQIMQHMDHSSPVSSRRYQHLNTRDKLAVTDAVFG